MIVVAELEKPCTDKDRADFIVEYNRKQGLLIEEDDVSIKALDYDSEEKEQQEQTKRDEEAQAELQKTIAAIKADMISALLSDDTEWQEELKDEYNAILNGEE